MMTEGDSREESKVPSRTIRATLYIEPDLHRALRIKSAVSRRSMSEIVNQAVRVALREDQEDLAAFATRASEVPVSYQEFLTQLKADGTI
jgi:hypothetical protein